MSDQPGHRAAPTGNAQGDTPAEVSPERPVPQRPVQSPTEGTEEPTDE